MTAWTWLTKPVVMLIHDVQLSIHGGAPGIRDEALLESALARPQNLEGYGTPDAAALAASYAFGIARNHPFVDGNKRTAFVTAMTFLIDNGYQVAFPETEVVYTIARLAAGEVPEDELAAWFRANMSRGLHEDSAAFSHQTKARKKRAGTPKPRLKSKPKPKPKAKPKKLRRKKRG